MSNSRQAKVRGWSLAIAALGLALWIGSIAIPILFGEDRGWTDADSKAYEDAGARLHALIEGSHDHDEERHFDNEEAARAYAEMQRQKRRTHVQVDPRDLAQAQAVFNEQKARLDAARSGNIRQIRVLYWGGVALMVAGGVGFFAAVHADD